MPKRRMQRTAEAKSNDGETKPPPSPLEADLQPLGERIRLRMKEVGLNQTQLAQRAGVDRSELSRIINGTRSPKAETLTWIAQALGLELPAFLEGLELPPVLAQKREEVAALARKVLGAEAAAQEARAEVARLQAELVRQRCAASSEHQRLHAELVAERENRAADRAEHEKAYAQLRAELETERECSAQTLDGVRNERDQAVLATATVRGQLSGTLQLLAKERSAKVGIGILAGLAGMMSGAALRGAQDAEELEG